MSVDLYFNVRN